MLAKYSENKQNGAQRYLIMKNWLPTCVWSWKFGAQHAESYYEDLFLEAIPKEGVHDLCERNHSHIELCENFSGMFGEIQANIFRIPKNLPAPTYTYGNSYFHLRNLRFTWRPVS